LESAGPAELSFAADRKRLKAARASAAGLLLLPPESGLADRSRLEVRNVWRALAEVLRRLYPEPRPAPGIHPSAVIGQGVGLGPDVIIGPGCVLGDGARLGEGVWIGSNCTVGAGCEVGEGSRLHDGVTLVGKVRVGRRVILHGGVVLGAEGFRFEPTPEGIIKVPQVGIVVVEDEVEIGANTTVDRAFLSETRIGAGTKIDNLVQIGHNCRIGRRCLIAGCVALSGSVTVEDDCILGGRVSINNGVTVGRGSILAGLTALRESCPPGSFLSGFPALPVREWLKTEALLARLPEIHARLKALEARGRAPDA